MFRSRCLLLAALFGALLPAPEALAHGSHGGAEGEALEAGEFDFTPVITLEGHGGFDTNLEGDPKHYAIDGMFGGVFQWGLGNGSSLSIEAAVGPTLVWGESEHFYGKVHVDDHHDEEGHDEHDHGSHDDHDDDDHDHHDHADEHDHDDHDHGDHADDHHDHDDHDHEAHARRSRRQLRAKAHDDHDEHDHSDHGHSDHGHDDHGHAHTHDTDFKRTDFKGYVQVRYAPNDRLDLALSWMPYWVTEDEGDDVQGLKNELGAKLTWALGDGDVNFGLGDSFSDLVDGVYVSVDHRQGWESDGVWIGNTPIRGWVLDSRLVVMRSAFGWRRAHVSIHREVIQGCPSELTLLVNWRSPSRWVMPCCLPIGNRFTRRKKHLVGVKGGNTTSAQV